MCAQLPWRVKLLDWTSLPLMPSSNSFTRAALRVREQQGRWPGTEQSYLQGNNHHQMLHTSGTNGEGDQDVVHPQKKTTLAGGVAHPRDPDRHELW